MSYWEYGGKGNGFKIPYLDVLTSYLTDVPDNEEQFKVQSFLYGVDPTGFYKGYLDQRDSSNYWNDYFRNTGLSWSDVKYPTKMYGFGYAGATASRGINFIGHNIKRLYS